MPAVAACLAPGEGELLAMVKPQFELGRERVGKGVVRDAGDRREAVLGVARAAAGAGLAVRGFAPSGLPGPEGQHRDLRPLRGAAATGSATSRRRSAEVDV